MQVDIIKTDMQTGRVQFKYKLTSSTPEFEVLLPFKIDSGEVLFKMTEETLYDFVNLIRRNFK